MKPLSIIKARRLEDRSANKWDKKVKATKSVSPVRGASDRRPDSGSNNRAKPPSSASAMALDREYGGGDGSAGSGSLLSQGGQGRGWQTSSLSQGQAHARSQMIGMHEESKGRNFNPYVFETRARTGKTPPAAGAAAAAAGVATGDSATGGMGGSGEMGVMGGTGGAGGENSVPPSPLTIADPTRTPSMTDTLSSRWVHSHTQREGQVVRTYEDVTLTDTSRFVLS